MKRTYRIAVALLFVAIYSRTWSSARVDEGGSERHPQASQQPVAPGSPQPAAPVSPQPAAPVSPRPAATAPVLTSSIDSQTDEGAGKGADIDTIGHSPSAGSPYLGSKEALVVVNIFSDFQCPVCRRSADPIKQLILDFPDGSVKVLFRHNALPIHPRSQAAALAALAAGKQGKFWHYHDKLFASRGGLEDATLRQIAQDLGLDMARWEKDIADPANVARINEESAAATKVGATGTPGIFVNGLRSRGWGSYGGLKAMVARELAKGKELAATGEPALRIQAARIRAMAGTNPKAPNEGDIDPEIWVKTLTAD